MRHVKLLISLIVLAAGVLVWFLSRVPDVRTAEPSEKRETNAHAAPSEETLAARSASERAAVSPPALSGDSEATNGFADSPDVIAHAGDENVVLTMSTRAGMHLYAIDERTSEPCWARFSVQGRDPVRCHRSVGSVFMKGPLDPMSLDDLSEGVYDISACTEDGRVGIVHGVAIVGGAEPAKVTVRVAPGARMRIRLEGEAQILGLEIVSEGMLEFLGVVSNGKGELAVVPPGVTTVRLKRGTTLLEERQVSAQVGETVEVVFRRDG